jgi:hypothetical protein
MIDKARELLITALGKLFGYVVVSGCPRSGTSLTMDILRAMFGEDKILGSKFPQEARNKEEMIKQIEDNEDLKEIEKYFFKRQFDVMPAHELERLEKARDMNPNGFWECAFSVRGIQYLPMMKEELAKVLSELRIVKVVSQGLLRSNPLYINRIVFLIRHPRAVAKSQERLERGIHVMGDDGEVYNLTNGPEMGPDGEPIVFKWHEPDMFINVSLQALTFIKENKHIPIKFIEFEDLVSNPEKNIKEIYSFTGMEGDLQKGLDIVEPKLNRSRHEDVELSYWCDAEYVYEALLKMKRLYEEGRKEEVDTLVDETVEYMQDPKREYHLAKNQWRCFRAKEIVNREKCLKCINKDPKTLYRLKKNSESIGTEHWSTQPCPFECGMDAFREKPLTIEESIENNHWVVSKFSSVAPSPLMPAAVKEDIPADLPDMTYIITQYDVGFGPGHDGSWSLRYVGINGNGEHVWTSDRTRENDHICMCYTGNGWIFAFSPDPLAEGTPFPRFEYATANGTEYSDPGEIKLNVPGNMNVRTLIRETVQ